MILFEQSWEKYAVNHLKSKELARGLINNAAVALAKSHSYPGLMFWVHAAQGGAGILNVLKGPHQPKGVSDEVVHLRMRLYIEGSEKGSLKYENTTFATDFHLYTTILNPKAHPEEYQFQPTRLTYKPVWESDTPVYTQVEIVGGSVLTNNLK